MLDCNGKVKSDIFSVKFKNQIDQILEHPADLQMNPKFIDKMNVQYDKKGEALQRYILGLTREFKDVKVKRSEE